MSASSTPSMKIANLLQVLFSNGAVGWNLRKVYFQDYSFTTILVSGTSGVRLRPFRLATAGS